MFFRNEQEVIKDATRVKSQRISAWSPLLAKGLAHMGSQENHLMEEDRKELNSRHLVDRVDLHVPSWALSGREVFGCFKLEATLNGTFSLLHFTAVGSSRSHQ